MENLLQSVVVLQRRQSDAGIASLVIGGVAVAANQAKFECAIAHLKILNRQRLLLNFFLHQLGGRSARSTHTIFVKSN